MSAAGLGWAIAFETCIAYTAAKKGAATEEASSAYSDFFMCVH